MRWSDSLLAVCRAGVVAAGCAALVAGCGNRHLVLKVDVLSYLDPSSTQFAFGPVPVMPGGFYSGEQVLSNTEVNLVEGMDSVADVEGISIAMSALLTDSTGAGTDTLRLYLSDPNVDPLATTPVLVMPMTFTPGQTDTVDVEVGGDTRVADLFTQKRMRLTLTTAFRGPDSGSELNASMRIGTLSAMLVAGRKNL